MKKPLFCFITLLLVSIYSYANTISPSMKAHIANEYERCVEEELEESAIDFEDAELVCYDLLDQLSEDDKNKIIQGIRKKYGQKGAAGFYDDGLRRVFEADTSSFPSLNRRLEPMFSVTTEECSGGGTSELVCSFDENQDLVATTGSNLQLALSILKNSGLEITAEGALVAGATVGTIALFARYARSFNPLGAFALGLGVAPVAASDYCSMYSSNEGFEHFINELSGEQQIQELVACPEFSQIVLNTAIRIQNRD